MSDSQPSGFKGFLWSLAGAWVAAAGLNFFGWLFPSVDAFFETSNKVLSAVWSFLTATWTVPAVPLVLGAFIVVFIIARLALRAPAARSAAGGYVLDDDLTFNFAEAHILKALLHADRPSVASAEVYMQGDHPELVLNDAAESLQRKGLIS